jgi:uncharacterized membrane protein YciS (DUF1049 family)
MRAKGALLWVLFVGALIVAIMLIGVLQGYWFRRQARPLAEERMAEALTNQASQDTTLPQPHAPGSRAATP